VTFGYRVLFRTSLTTLCRGWYSRLSGLNRFQGEFRGGQRGFQFVWFIITGIFRCFRPKIGFYKRASKASRSVRKLYRARFAFYSQ
jgi:hypothetical protein